MHFEESFPINVARFVVSVTTICGNATIAIIVVRYAVCRKSLCNCLIGLLAVVDFVIGIAMLGRAVYSTYIGSSGAELFDRLTCVHINMTQTCGITTGQIVILCIALDRLMAVQDPVSYARRTPAKNRLFLLAVVVLCLLVGAFTAFLPYYTFIPGDAIPVCTLGPIVEPLWFYCWSTYTILTSVVIIGAYLACFLVFMKHYRSTGMSHSESNALKTQTQLLASISLVVLLYGVLHMVPNVVFTVFGYLGIKTNTMVAGIYGIGTGVYSGATLFVYLFKHRTIRECFLLMIGKKPPNQVHFTTVSAIRASHERVSH